MKKLGNGTRWIKTGIGMLVLTAVVGGAAQAAATPDAASISPASLLSCPDKPTVTRGRWHYYRGNMRLKHENYYDPHGVDYAWAYARWAQLPEKPRVLVRMHGTSGGPSSVARFGPQKGFDIELRTLDAEAKKRAWQEWWAVGRDGKGYPGRRIALALDYLSGKYNIDADTRGIVLNGQSMGGAGAVLQTLLMPEPWRQSIAYSTGTIGIVMPRRVARQHPGQFRSWPKDTPRHAKLWDSVDFSIQAQTDPVVRGMHYRHRFSTDDPFSDGPDGNTQLEFVNLVEKHRIGGAFVWIRNNHRTREKGVNLPWILGFEAPEQDVTLDRAHPAITDSTGNHPPTASERVDEASFPRGHYNIGIIWDHANIIDRPSTLVFPLKYRRHTDMGKGIPDQPTSITVSVTPRRTRHFAIVDGERIDWDWNNGERSGSIVVDGDLATVTGIPLTSGDGYKMLTFSKPEAR